MEEIGLGFAEYIAEEAGTAEEKLKPVDGILGLGDDAFIAGDPRLDTGVTLNVPEGGGGGGIKEGVLNVPEGGGGGGAKEEP